MIRIENSKDKMISFGVIFWLIYYLFFEGSDYYLSIHYKNKDSESMERFKLMNFQLFITHPSYLALG